MSVRKLSADLWGCCCSVVVFQSNVNVNGGAPAAGRAGWVIMEVVWGQGSRGLIVMRRTREPGCDLTGIKARAPQQDPCSPCWCPTLCLFRCMSVLFYHILERLFWRAFRWAIDSRSFHWPRCQQPLLTAQSSQKSNWKTRQMSIVECSPSSESDSFGITIIEKPV